MKLQPISPIAQIALFFLTPFLLGMSIDLYVPSLPVITHYFSVAKHLTQLTISSYLLGYGIGQLFLGIISDSLGRKKLLVIGALLFMLFSFMCTQADSIYQLIAYRFFQGIAVAGKN